MMPWSHIGRERMLLLVGERLAPVERSCADFHLQRCAKCRARFESARVAHLVLADLTSGSEQRWRTLLDQPISERRARASARNLQFGILTAGVCALVVLIAFALLSPTRRVEAKTTELLNRSVSIDTAQPSNRRLLLTLEGSICPYGSSAALRQMAASPICDRAALRLKQTPWSTGNILSSSPFLQWRAQQPSHHDVLKHQSDRWIVTTSSDSGVVQEASLELQEKSLHAVRLTLHFRDSSELLVVTENASPTEPNEHHANLAELSDHQPIATQASEDNMADRLEVKTWQLLHNAGADSAWTSSVVRKHEQVDVEVYAADPETRRRILYTFRGLPNQNAKVNEKQAGPTRRMSGAGPALSEGWLEEQMPEITKQNEFKSRISHLSRDVMGKAIWLERLSDRRRALQSCECAKELDGLMATEQNELLAMETQLASSLAPYTRASASPRLLHASDASELDLALQHLFLSSDLSQSQVSVEDATLRHLLNVN